MEGEYSMSTVTFIGAGSFGTALSTIVAAKGCRVNIFDIDKAHLDRMEEAMENVDYLPGVKLSGDYHFYTDNEAALKRGRLRCFLACRSIFVRGHKTRKLPPF